MPVPPASPYPAGMSKRTKRPTWRPVSYRAALRQTGTSYEVLAAALQAGGWAVSESTARKWAKNGSRGPRHLPLVKAIEKLLGLAMTVPAGSRMLRPL